MLGYILLAIALFFLFGFSCMGFEYPEHTSKLKIFFHPAISFSHVHFFNGCCAAYIYFSYAEFRC